MKTKVSNIIWGSLFILAGIGFIGNVFNLWSFNLFFNGFWTLFIIIPSAISIIENGPKPFPLTALVVGILLMLSSLEIFEYEKITQLIVPVILIAIGLSLVTKNFRGPRKMLNFKEGFSSDTEYTAIFSGQNITYMENEVFQGASVSAIFGGAKIDLRSAIINEDVRIDCTAIFGGVDVFVPGDVNIKVSSTPIFGGVDNKRNHQRYIENAPTIYINALCMFGGVDIK